MATAFPLTIIYLFFTSLDYTNALTGYASNYGEGNPYGNACGMQGTSDTFGNWAYAATGDTRYDSGYGCGKCYTVRCTGAYGHNPSCSCDTSKSLTIQALDQCSECTGTHAFDLTATAMTYFTGSDSMTGTCGLISVEYERVDCSSVSGNFKVTNKGGTSQDWYGMHLSDVNGDGGIRYVEILKDGSSIATCDKSQGTSFWICNGGSKLSANVPLDIKITSDLGESVTASNCITSFVGGTEMTCNTNLASGGTPSPTSVTPAPIPVPTASPIVDPSCDGSTNARFVTHEDSQIYWMAIFIYDLCTCCGSITRVEAKDSSSYTQWVNGTDLGYPLWAWDDVATNHGGQPWTQPVSFRITNSDGEIQIFQNVLTGVGSGVSATGSINLCRSASCDTSSTDEPTTSAPTTASPTTATPTTSSPTTSSPTTSSPTTSSPTTSSPTTSSPTTLSPTHAPLRTGETRAPTGTPTTASPTTASPTTTSAPTTGSPTQAPLESGQTRGPTANPTTASPTSAPSMEGDSLSSTDGGYQGSSDCGRYFVGFVNGFIMVMFIGIIR